MADYTTYQLVRHGWADWAGAGQRSGPRLPADLTPLTPHGEDRIRTLAPRLREVGPTAVLSSPLTRAVMSAHILSRELALPLVVEPDLREWLPDLATAASPEPGQFQQSVAEMMAVSGEIPVGLEVTWEPLSHLRARVGRALSGHHGSLVVVTHSLVIYALTGLDVPPGGLVSLTHQDLQAGRPPRRRMTIAPPTAREAHLLIAGPPGGTSVLCFGYTLPERVDVLSMDRALRRLVQHHAILRARFRAGQGGFLREISDFAEVACSVADDVRGTNDADGWVESDVLEPLLPLEWPLIRVRVLRGTENSVLSLAVHPLVADHWMAQRIGADLLTLYRQELAASGGERRLPVAASLPFSCTASGSSRGRRTGQAHGVAANPVPITALPAEEPHHRVEILDSVLADAFRRRCREESADVSAAVLGALACVLHGVHGAGTVTVLLGRMAGLSSSVAGDWRCTEYTPVCLPTCPVPELAEALAVVGRTRPDPLGAKPYYAVTCESRATLPSDSASPAVMAWGLGLPALIFEAPLGAGLHGWQPEPAGRGPTLHDAVAELLRCWAEEAVRR